MLFWISWWWAFAVTLIGSLSLYTFLVPFAISAFCFNEQNLKRKYGATWALVTGASSGIGRALTERLAAQGLNVVLVALDEPLFDETLALLRKQYPAVEFRRVGANLGGQPESYMPAIEAATADIVPQLVFNNAGFVITGLFADSPLGRQLGNYHCNATAPVVISHFFANRLLNAGLKGAIAFTSSPAGLLPTPLTSMYAATKAFLTTFAGALAAELRPDGIDVLVVHPSPVNTAFYAGNTHNIGAMAMAQRASYAPTAIAAVFFRSMGRVVVADHGYMSLFMRLLVKAIDVSLLATVMSWFASMSDDYKRAKVPRPMAGSAAAPASKVAAVASPVPLAAERASSRSASVTSQPTPRARKARA